VSTFNASPMIRGTVDTDDLDMPIGLKMSLPLALALEDIFYNIHPLGSIFADCLNQALDKLSQATKEAQSK
jgi:hypothetical protein